MEIKIQPKFVIGQPKKKVLLFIMVACMFPPRGIFTLLPAVGSVWNLLRIAACLGLILMCVVRKRLTTVSILFIAFFSYIPFITFVRGGELLGACIRYVPVISSICLFAYYKNNIKCLFSTVSVYLTLLLIINLVCVILYPDGMYKATNENGYTANWLVGYKNNFMFYFYPLYVIKLMNIAYGKKKLSSIIVIAICIIESRICSDETLFAALMLCSLYFIVSLKRKRCLVDPKIGVIIILALDLLVVSGEIIQIGLARNFITEFLGRSTTFSGRDYVWEITIASALQTPFLGHGIVSGALRPGVLGHGHNLFLEVFYQGGLVWAIQLVVLLLYICSCLKKNITKKAAIVLCTALFGMLLMGIFEPMIQREDGLNWLMLILCCNVDLVDKEMSESTA